MKNTNSCAWKSKLLLFVVLALFSTEISAQPSAPKLTVVQPMYGSPSGMYLEWKEVAGAQEYQFRKKVNDGEYGEWNNDCRLSTAFKDLFEIIPGATYTYEVRVVVNDDESDSSAPRSTKVVKMWPVTASSDCTADESLNLLHGFNQAIYAVSPEVLGSTKYLHQGLDLTGEQNLDRECVRAPMGGMISTIERIDPKTREIDNGFVDLHVWLNDRDYRMTFGHLEGINDKLKERRSVEPGTFLGYITSSHFNKTVDNHVHSVLDDAMILKNPLEAWDSEQEQYRDPQGNFPNVEDTNSDHHAVRFRKGPDEAAYLPDNGKVYGPVDIVVEARDHQSSYKEGPWQNPLKIGYYIQKEERNAIINVVRAPNAPYLLIDGSNWFGDLGIEWTTLDRIQTLFDIDDMLKCNLPEEPPE